MKISIEERFLVFYLFYLFLLILYGWNKMKVHVCFHCFLLLLLFLLILWFTLRFLSLSVHLPYLKKKNNKKIVIRKFSRIWVVLFIVLIPRAWNEINECICLLFIDFFYSLHSASLAYQDVSDWIKSLQCFLFYFLPVFCFCFSLEVK